MQKFLSPPILLLALAALPATASDELQVRCGLAVRTAADFGFDGPEVGVQCEADLDVGPLTLLGSARHLKVEKYQPSNPGNSGDQQNVAVGAEWRLSERWRSGVTVGRGRYRVRDFGKGSDNRTIFAAYESERRYRFVVGAYESEGDANRAEGFMLGHNLYLLRNNRLWYGWACHLLDLEVRDGSGWRDTKSGTVAAQLVVGWRLG